MDAWKVVATEQKEKPLRVFLRGKHLRVRRNGFDSVKTCAIGKWKRMADMRVFRACCTFQGRIVERLLRAEDVQGSGGVRPDWEAGC